MSLGVGSSHLRGGMERGPGLRVNPPLSLYPSAPIISSVLSPLPYKPSGSWSSRSWHPLVGHEDTEGFLEAWPLMTTGSRVREKLRGHVRDRDKLVIWERIGSRM